MFDKSTLKLCTTRHNLVNCQNPAFQNYGVQCAMSNCVKNIMSKPNEMLCRILLEKKVHF